MLVLVLVSLLVLVLVLVRLSSLSVLERCFSRHSLYVLGNCMDYRLQPCISMCRQSSEGFWGQMDVPHSLLKIFFKEEINTHPLIKVQIRGTTNRCVIKH